MLVVCMGEDNSVEKKKLVNQTYYGLPKTVKFCTKCVISNQRPNSAVEYSHTSESKKKTINFKFNIIK